LCFWDINNNIVLSEVNEWFITYWILFQSISDVSAKIRKSTFLTSWDIILNKQHRPNICKEKQSVSKLWHVLNLISCFFRNGTIKDKELSLKELRPMFLSQIINLLSYLSPFLPIAFFILGRKHPIPILL
jgi:hypothetical protein